MKRGILIFALVILVLFCMTSVCASDINNTAMANEDDSGIELTSTENNLKAIEDNNATGNGEIISASDDETVAAESDTDVLGDDAGTWSGLSTELSGSGIVDMKLLHKYYTYDEGSTISINFNGGRIDGQGAVIDMAGLTIQPFNVANSLLTIRNLTIINANYDGDGGAIYFNSKGTLENCNFINNTASGNGGAVYFKTKGTVTNCNFSNNTASGSGGAVFFSEDSTVTNCSFENNTASAKGGAVFFSEDGTVTDSSFINNSGTSGGAVCFNEAGTATNCNFSNNTAEYGGAVTIRQNNGNISYCNFINNTASGYGGAAYFLEHGEVSNCNFINNKAQKGTIYFDRYNGVVVNCNFTNNTANDGGAININMFNNNSTVTNCNFINNTAKNGGAIDMRGRGSVTNCNFVNNHAPDGDGLGGAILVRDFTTITNCSFTNNSASRYGGAVYFYTTGEVTNCNFTNNTSIYGGGALDLNNDYDGTNVKNCNFINNKARSYGGAIESYYVTLENCNFTNNTSNYIGGAICIWEEGKLTNCNFTNNKATSNGGAVYISANGQITNSNFITNEAEEYGGAIYFQYASDKIVKDCNFTNNHASYGGAVYFCPDGEVTTCNFANNTAKFKGGAIFFDDKGNVINCNFTDNSAENGGAAYFSSATTTQTIVNSKFANNKATSKGGAVYIKNEAEITNSKFINNTGSIGAIYCEDLGLTTADTCILKTDSDTTHQTVILPPTLNVDNFTSFYNSGEKLTFDLKTNSSIPVEDGNISISVYSKNNDTWVGNYSCLSSEEWTVDLPIGSYYAIFNTEYAEFKPINRTITITPNNRFLGLNQTINDNDDAEVNLTMDYYYDSAFDGAFANGIIINRKVTINGNGHTIDAMGKARVFNVESSDMTIKNLTIINASYDGNGGAIYFNYKGTLENCNFENNYAKYGGVVYFNGIGVVTNCNFTNNQALNEGGTIVFNDRGNVTDCNFTNNTARYSGAINFKDYGTLSNCNFINSKATADLSHSGAVHLYSGTVEHCNFINNSVKYKGGAILISIDGNLTDCNFINNKVTNYNSWGGAIYFSGTGNAENCNFENNSARQGGAIYSYSNATVKNCNFTNNQATTTNGLGGAINFGESCYAATVENSNFIANNAVKGSAIYFNLEATAASISNSILLNNKVIGYRDLDTPLQINKNDDKIEITFLGNNNFLNAIYSSGEISFINVTYWGANGITNTGSSLITSRGSNREAGQNITAIMVVDDILVLNTTKVTDENGTVVLEAVAGNCTITAGHDDDSYYSETEATETFNNAGTETRLDFNTFAFTVTAIITPNIGTGNVTFTVENQSGIIKTSESALINGAAKLDLTGFAEGEYNITATYFGNVTYCPSKSSMTYVLTNNGTYSQLAYEIGSGGDKNLTFKYYTYDSGSTITISNAGVIDGRGAVIDMAGSDIQAFYVWCSGVTFKNLTIKNVNYNGEGGAIYFYNSATVENCNFIHNTALLGGAVFFFWGSTGTFLNCTFTNNTARSGGAIYSEWGYEDTIDNCNFDGNTAYDNGGAVYFSNSVNITNSNFSNNKAQNGGGVYFDYEDCEVINCMFINNSAENGGAIYSDEDSGVTADTCIFKTDSDTTYQTLILPPTLNVDNFISVYNSGEKLTFDLKTNCGMPVYNGNISISLYYKNNDTWVDNYSFLSNEEWTVDLPVGSYYAILNTEYAKFEPLNITIKILPDVPFYANVTPAATNNRTVNITAKSNIPNDIIEGQLQFVLDNGTEISANYNADGTWWAVYTFDDYDDYNVNASYIGFSNITFNNATISITKANSTVNVTDVVLDYGYSKNVTVTAEGATGITAMIDGNPVEVINNYTIPISGLAAGNYTLTVTTIPDGDHESVTKTVNITVNKVNSTLAVNNIIFNYDSSGSASVSCTGAAGINASVEIHPEAIVNVTDNIITVSNLNAGNYTLKVTTIPDENHTEVTKTANITVNKVNATLTINDDIVFDYGSSNSTTVDFTGADYIEAIVVGHDEAIVEVTGKTITVSGLDAGNYTLSVTAVADSNHNNVTKTADITVNKAVPAIEVSTNDVTYPEKVTVTVKSDIAGYYTVTIGEESKDLVLEADTAKEINFTELDANEEGYIINVTFGETANYAAAFNDTVSVKVFKADSSVTVYPVDNIIYPSNVEVIYDVTNRNDITVELANVDTGDVIDVPSECIDENTITLEGLTVGNYIITVINEGRNYKTSNASASFKVIYSSSVTIDSVDNVTCGKDAVITYTVENKTTISVVVKDSQGSEITEGIDTSVEGTVTISGLDIGTYTITIYNAAEGNYDASSAEAEFNVVDKSDVEFSKAKGHPGRVDQNATVEVILSQSDATGTVSINIDGFDYSAELVDGKAVIYAPLLPAGTYNTDVVYSGDDNYKNNTAPITFNVNKYYPTMKATAESVRVDENATVNVALPSDATGTVTITVDGVDCTADVVDGTAAVVLPVISQAGSQAFNVTYSGDDKYRPYTTGVEFNVLKYNAKIKATARTVKIGNNVTVNVALPNDATGEASIDINGTVYTGTVEYGAASIIIPDLGVGQYELTVDYSGDDKYKPANTTVTFNVNKQTTSLKATARTVKVSEDVNVNVKLADDATGEIIINVDGTDYTATAENGSATIVIPDLAYGQYALNVQYRGDDKYKAINTTVTFNVNKQSTTMKATARTVKVGDNVTVNVALASDATGEVIISIDGTDYTATVENGVASIVLCDLPADQYSLAVKYSGDDKYKNQSTTVKFNVNKYNVRMKVTTKYNSDDDYAIVSAKLSDDATGSLSTELNGNTYLVKIVDSKGFIVIPSLPAGEYTLDVEYSGDTKYKEYTATTTFKV